ncbi:hypothetical protein NE237_009214 [Protea cynaroides]|uniref:Uncharacterized protein n=1 Tax=Protea cynaroides TaxID=273540 RepID=A0A9Q0R0F0_9MAGN|nr:hypothetical protein NE237_009214 [Protea cynaroides]
MLTLEVGNDYFRSSAHNVHITVMYNAFGMIHPFYRASDPRFFRFFRGVILLCWAMGRTLTLCSSLLFLVMLLFADLHLAIAADLHEISPSPAPAPESGGIDSPSPTALPPSPESGAPSSDAAPSPDYSPPAPPPSDLVPSPSPTPAPAPSSPAPSPSVHSDIKGAVQDETADSKGSSSDGGLKTGEKAGIATGVIAAVCVVGIFGIIYKKRQDNIRRSQYGYAVRRELL